MATILAVDDSTSIRQMVSFILKQEGYEVLDASDGIEALQIAENRQVDLVLTDLNMPQMDGIALIKALRSFPSYQHTPLLMLTTETSSEKKQQGREAGATGWIVKPFDPEQLVSVIGKILG
ncbi:MAG: response regulator [Sedimenticola sp.]|nr:response regulator [Sedimenticola sp.]